MKTKTQVARETADAFHEAEAAMDEALVKARFALERLALAKKEVGLTGTVGDAILARAAETVAALEQAKAATLEGHREAYHLLKMLNLRTFASIVTPEIHAEEAEKAA